MQKQVLIQLLPLAIIALVFWRRWKSMGTARPLRTGRMWIAPVLYAALVALMLWAMPPAQAGWLLFAGGMLVGAAVGWQRARLLHLHVDQASGMVMVRQSPAGLAVILGIFLLRRVFVPAQRGGTAMAGTHPALPLATDALLGFALGSIIGYRIELWRRARELRAAG